jgi:hypothetical protein
MSDFALNFDNCLFNQNHLIDLKKKKKNQKTRKFNFP